MWRIVKYFLPWGFCAWLDIKGKKNGDCGTIPAILEKKRFSLDGLDCDTCMTSLVEERGPDAGVFGKFRVKRGS